MAFVTSADAERCDYSFSADTEPTPLKESPYESPSSNEVRATSNYIIDESGDEWDVTGHTANGYGDAYVVDSPISEASIDCRGDGEIWAELNGERVSTDELMSRTGGGGGGSGDMPITYENCSAVTIGGEGEYNVELGTQYYGEDGVTTLTWEEDVTLPTTINVSDIDDSAVTDIVIEHASVMTTDSTDTLFEQSNPYKDACNDLTAAQYDVWRASEGDEDN